MAKCKAGSLEAKEVLQRHMGTLCIACSATNKGKKAKQKAKQRILCLAKRKMICLAKQRIFSSD